MEIKRVKLTEIRPYERNPRVNDHAVDAVAESIREFGWQQPIVVDSEGVIIAGHTRYKAAEKLKCMDVPVVVADKLTQDQVRAYRLADNKTGEKAEWDMELLEAELAELGDMDMGEFGFELGSTDDKRVALDLDDDARERDDTDMQICHCPKCGFAFEVRL